ncbi:hypothetical protein ACCD08_31780, partial [Telluria sp. Tellsp104]
MNDKRIPMRSMAAAAAALLALSGCQTTPSSATYDNIKGEVASGANKRPAAAPTVDAAVRPARGAPAPPPGGRQAQAPARRGPGVTLGVGTRG